MELVEDKDEQKRKCFGLPVEELKVCKEKKTQRDHLVYMMGDVFSFGEFQNFFVTSFIVFIYTSQAVCCRASSQM